MQTAAEKIVACIFWGIYVHSPILYILRSGIPESLGAPVVSSSRYCQFSSVWSNLYSFFRLESWLLCILINTWLTCLFHFSHRVWWMCDTNLHFHEDHEIEQDIFSCAYWPFGNVLWSACWILLTLDWVVCVFYRFAGIFLYILIRSPSSDMYVLLMSSPILYLAFSLNGNFVNGSSSFL